MTLRWLFPPGGEVTSLEQAYDPGAGPSLRGGFVLSTDGAIAVEGASAGLSSPADKQVFRALRAVADAVVVGAGTARSEDYRQVQPSPTGALWRAAHDLPPVAPLVIVTASAQLSPAARCFSPEGPRTVVVTCAGADPARRAALAEVADVLVVGEEQVCLPAMVTALHERGLTRLLCEGGPALLTDLLTAGLVDELCLTATPLLVGGAPGLLSRALPTPLRLAPVHLLDGGDGVLLGRWRVLTD